MKRRMSLEALRDFYRTDDVREGENCYEYTDKKTGMIYCLPLEFQVFMDGSLIDPIRFLKMPEFMQKMIFEGVFMPLEAEFLCGFCAAEDVRRDKIKFYPGDPMKGRGDLNAVIIRVSWDLREKVSGDEWDKMMHTMYGKRIIWHWQETDRYGTAGEYYWLIRAYSVQDAICFDLGTFFARYIDILSRVYLTSDKCMDDFEKEKREYYRKIRDYLDNLPERKHWILPAGEESKYDAHVELWQKNECDWLIIESKDCFKVKYCGESSGVILEEIWRFDAVGLVDCMKFVGEVNAMK